MTAASTHAPSEPVMSSHPVSSKAALPTMAFNDFRKQPVTPPPVGSDSEALSSDGGADRPQPVSLLSSMLSEHVKPRKSKLQAEAGGGYASGSAESSPSTALSSPKMHEEPVSILRRTSFGSDGEQFYLPISKAVPLDSAKLFEPTPTVLDAEIANLPKPALAPAPVPTAAALQVKPPHRRALKFAVANRPTEVDRPLPQREDSGDEAEDDTDGGYEEDSEDGFSDDEPGFMYKAHNMMTRARAVSEPPPRGSLRPVRSDSNSTSPRVSPPPPPRRGRGHIRVDPAAGQDHSSCTRHCSPPPSDVRSTPPPGPRDGRAGSPLPSPIDDEEDEEDEDEDENENDDEDEISAVQGVPVGNGSATGEQYTSSRADSAPPPSASSVGASVRGIMRRASEHVTSFRRPSFTTPIPEDDTVVLDDDTGTSDNSRVLLGRARSLGARTQRNKINALSPEPQFVRSQPVACPTRR